MTLSTVVLHMRYEKLDFSDCALNRYTCTTHICPERTAEINFVHHNNYLIERQINADVYNLFSFCMIFDKRMLDVTTPSTIHFSCRLLSSCFFSSNFCLFSPETLRSAAKSLTRHEAEIDRKAIFLFVYLSHSIHPEGL